MPTMKQDPSDLYGVRAQRDRDRREAAADIGFAREVNKFERETQAPAQDAQQAEMKRNPYAFHPAMSPGFQDETRRWQEGLKIQDDPVTRQMFMDEIAKRQADTSRAGQAAGQYQIETDPLYKIQRDQGEKAQADYEKQAAAQARARLNAEDHLLKLDDDGMFPEGSPEALAAMQIKNRRLQEAMALAGGDGQYQPTPATAPVPAQASQTRSVADAVAGMHGADVGVGSGRGRAEQPALYKSPHTNMDPTRRAIWSSDLGEQDQAQALAFLNEIDPQRERLMEQNARIRAMPEGPEKTAAMTIHLHTVRNLSGQGNQAAGQAPGAYGRPQGSPTPTQRAASGLRSLSDQRAAYLPAGGEKADQQARIRMNRNPQPEEAPAPRQAPWAGQAPGPMPAKRMAMPQAQGPTRGEEASRAVRGVVEKPVFQHDPARTEAFLGGAGDLYGRASRAVAALNPVAAIAPFAAQVVPEGFTRGVQSVAGKITDRKYGDQVLGAVLGLPGAVAENVGRARRGETQKPYAPRPFTPEDMPPWLKRLTDLSPRTPTQPGTSASPNPPPHPLSVGNRARRVQDLGDDELLDLLRTQKASPAQ